MKTRKLKPRRMWVDPELYALIGKDANVFSAKKCFPDDLQVAVIPLDDVPELIVKLAAAHYHYAKENRRASNGDCMRAALVAIGVLPKSRKQGGRK